MNSEAISKPKIQFSRKFKASSAGEYLTNLYSKILKEALFNGLFEIFYGELNAR